MIRMCLGLSVFGLGIGFVCGGYVIGELWRFGVGGFCTGSGATLFCYGLCWYIGDVVRKPWRSVL